MTRIISKASTPQYRRNYDSIDWGDDMSKDTYRGIDFSVRHYGDSGDWGGWVLENDKWILIGIYRSYVEGVRGCKKYIDDLN